MTVIDLGAAPGSWSQVAQHLVAGTIKHSKYSEPLGMIKGILSVNYETALSDLIYIVYIVCIIDGLKLIEFYINT